MRADTLATLPCAVHISNKLNLKAFCCTFTGWISWPWSVCTQQASHCREVAHPFTHMGDAQVQEGLGEATPGIFSSLHCDSQLTESASLKHRLFTSFWIACMSSKALGTLRKCPPRLEREGGLPLVRMLRVGEELQGIWRHWFFPK